MDSRLTNPPLLGGRLRNNKLSYEERPQEPSPHEPLGAEGRDEGLQELPERAVCVCAGGG